MQNFVRCSDPRQNESYPVRTERRRPVFRHEPTQIGGCRPTCNCVAHRVAHRQQLVGPDPVVVAGSTTMRAANACPRRNRAFGESKLPSSAGIDFGGSLAVLSLIHISEPTRLLSISYAVFCLKKK